MTVSPALTEDDALRALRAFLVGIVPSGWEVVRGQVNRVPTPDACYVQMTPLMRRRLSTNRHLREDQTVTIWTPMQLTVQIDCRGDGAADVAQTIATLFRDQYAISAFQAVIRGVVPLYTSDPRQVPFMTAESQYQDRWSLDAEMQFNAIITVPEQSASKVSLGIIEVDEHFPPQGGM